MPDRDGITRAGENSVPETPFTHTRRVAKKPSRGDTEKLNSDDPKDLKASEIEDKDDPKLYME
jgi:hypothetical protein